MSRFSPPRHRFVAAFGMLAAACLAVASGCDQPDPIVTYTIPTKVPVQLLAGKDRMLAVMLPKGSDIWFFKVTGPEKAIAEIETTFRSFVADVPFTDDGPDLSELPDNWRRAGEKPMRFASVNIDTAIDTAGKQLDLSISKLSRQDDWDAQVKLNVNRWRGQIGLEPSEEKWASAKPIELSSADAAGIWVDITGQSSGASMTPPFAGGGPFSRGELPEDHPPVVPSSEPVTPPSAPQTDSRLNYDRPEGWRDGKMSSMRMAAFDVGPEDSPAEITVIAAGGDLKGNVKRWMGQVRQAEVSDQQLDQAMADAISVHVSNLPGQRYVLTGEEETIDATIVPMDGGMSVFIKMKGPAKTVADQFEAIELFLKSIKLNLQ